MAEAVAEQKKEKISATRALRLALSNRKTGFMALFGFASGLPFSLFLGTLYAWLSEAEVDLETMGVFSLIGLAYAFQFLWSPLVDRLDIPGLRRLGKRKQWIAPMQLLLGIILLTMAFLEPRSQLGWFSLLAGIGAFASATQDIVINAWRIDVADEEATLDILSTVTQMGFRLAALVGGALGLIIAARIGWPETYLIMGGIMLAIGIAGLFAPDADVDAATATSEHAAKTAELYEVGEIAPKQRNLALAAVGILWAWAIGTVLVFMVRSMTALPEDRPNPTEFTATYGPLIIIATIVIPAFIAAYLVKLKKDGKYVITEGRVAGKRDGLILDQLYRALVLPLVEFVGRMGWSLVLILALVLTYRICDAIWGVFAYPFYLGELNYTNDEVAFASKFFGVGAIVAGLALGGYMLTVIGRMATLTLGALLAALTNLLYADLAIGGATMQAGSDLIGFTALIQWMAPFGSEGLPRLTFTIMFENLAIGIAGAAYIAWLSSIVSKGYSAVQYALLASLTLLVATLGRGALGEMIENQGYYDVFILTTFIGFIAVVLCILEWIREKTAGRRSGVVTPDATHEVATGA
ncbi:MFS transporter [Qipengyuania sp. 1NDH17]|uniref:MFS transporter n=1 Tax=Qipengyuania polymorpha TaxID=2867234 RepID=A0ABS7IUZ1_9SPHN|nr:MFS transporter [Qipengyuania polymorpha]MBX7457246.1 MFS transporter [Qipengyuania polymorpha]